MGGDGGLYYSLLFFTLVCIFIVWGLSSVGILCGWDLHYGDQIGLVDLLLLFELLLCV
jgi:hypothetical protein